MHRREEGKKEVVVLAQRRQHRFLCRRSGAGSIGSAGAVGAVGGGGAE